MGGIVRRALVRQIERLETSSRALEQALAEHQVCSEDYATLRFHWQHQERELEAANAEIDRLRTLYEPTEADLENSINARPAPA